jgi:hypothetical protein
MKWPLAIVILVVVAVLVVFGMNRPRTGLLERCLDLQGRWSEQAAACAAQMWPDDRTRGRE